MPQTLINFLLPVIVSHFQANVSPSNFQFSLFAAANRESPANRCETRLGRQSIFVSIY